MAPRLKKTDGILDWTRPAGEIADRIRGCNPWPGASTDTPVGTLRIWRARSLAGATDAPPGTLVAAGDTLARLDTVTPTPQRHEDATSAPRLKKTDGDLNWTRPAREIADRVHGCNPWPGASTATPVGPLRIWRARPLATAADAAPGTLVAADDTLAVASGGGLVLPIEVQPESRRAVTWAEFLRGARLVAGARLSKP